MYTLKIRSLLGPGTGKVRFKDCVAPNEFAPEWNGNRHFPRWAPWVTVSRGHDTQLNAAMLRWGAITGIVTDQATALPIPDICIRVFKVFSKYAHRRPVGFGWARTRSDGTYEVLVRHVISWRGFKVRFSECDLLRGYSTEWFDNFTTPWRTTRVVVSQGTTTSGSRCRARSCRRRRRWWWRRWRWGRNATRTSFGLDSSARSLRPAVLSGRPSRSMARASQE